MTSDLANGSLCCRGGGFERRIALSSSAWSAFTWRPIFVVAPDPAKVFDTPFLAQEAHWLVPSGPRNIKLSNPRWPARNEHSDRNKQIERTTWNEHGGRRARDVKNLMKNRIF